MWPFLQWQEQLLNKFYSDFLKCIISYIQGHYRKRGDRVDGQRVLTSCPIWGRKSFFRDITFSSSRGCGQSSSL